LPEASFGDGIPITFFAVFVLFYQGFGTFLYSVDFVEFVGFRYSSDFFDF
jgi:hypothetical protein